MRLAVLADIHGNLHALEAVCQDLRRQAVDRVYVAGDIVNICPDSAACWQKVHAAGFALLRGNHERYVFDLDAPHAPPEWQTPRFAPVRYCAAQFDAAQRRAMAALPLTLAPEGCNDLLIAHASARSDADSVLQHAPDSHLDACFAGTSADLIVRGHNHMQAERRWRGRTVLTAGSVGLPLDGCHDAQYLVLERRRQGWHWTFRAVPYDLDAAVARFGEGDYMEVAGPMARLFRRELLTATLQVIPFLRLYRAWGGDDGIALDAAVQRFLAI